MDVNVGPLPRSTSARPSSWWCVEPPLGHVGGQGARPARPRRTKESERRMPHVFVFGTLKRGQPLHKCGLAGALLLDDYRTVEPFLLVIAEPWFAPMMFNEPGCRHHVFGEVYRIDASRLHKLDRLESLGKPGNFRIAIEVLPVAAGQPLRAFAYMKSRELADGERALLPRVSSMCPRRTRIIGTSISSICST